MRNFFFPLAFFLLAACGQSQQPAETGDAPKSKADSLLQEVIDGHDVAMPKMKKLERLIKESKAAIDSINKLPAPAQKQYAALKTRLEATLTDLTNADKAMQEWMSGFKYDSLKDDEPARISYLEDQKTKVNSMKDVVLKSIEKADSVLSKN